MAKPVFPVPDI